MKTLLRVVVLVSVVLQCLPGPAVAQFGGGGFGQGGGGFGGGNQGGGVGGIRISADGVVQQARVSGKDARELKIELYKAAKELPDDLKHASPLRMISLAKLDRELARLAREHADVPSEIPALAGLTRIDLIALTEDGQDVIIAGPAEAFAPGPDGRLVGIDSGRPVLWLDDLLIALRTPDPGSGFGCSFDPDPQRLVNTMTALQNPAPARTIAEARRGFEVLREVIGNWNVRILGVPADSRMAVSMVEADHLLKLLTSGAEKPDVRGFKSQLAMMSPHDDALKRWWFSPDYDAIERSADRRLWHLSGQRLQVHAQEEMVDAEGNRSDAPENPDELNEFARQFTARIPQLADEYPAIAHLQNLFDLLITAAIIRDAQADGRLSWTPSTLTDTAAVPTATFVVPTETESVVTVRVLGGRTVIGLIAGGVIVSPRAVLAAATESASLQSPAADSSERWWWDGDASSVAGE
jgi:hypothetical protein